MKYSEALLKSRLSFQNSINCQFISNYEIEPFMKFLRAVGSDDYIEYHVRQNGYNNLLNSLMKFDADKNVDFVFLFVLIEDLFPELSYRTTLEWSLSSIDNMLETSTDRINQFVRIVEKYSIQVDCDILILSPYLSLPPVVAGPDSLYSSIDGLYFQLVHKLTSLCSRQNKVHMLSPNRVYPSILFHELRNPKLLFEAGIPISLPGIEQMAIAVHKWFYQKQEPKKLLITDLDFTLWHGVIGDDGFSISSHADSNTYSYYIYQNFLKLLLNEGILLAVCSKNNYSVVVEHLKNRTFCESTGLRISFDDFSVFSCSWEAKSIQISKICEKLNILPSSAVFIDDNPLELYEVSSSIPELTCISFPDTKDFHTFLEDVRSYFIKPSNVTNEDVNRERHYKLRDKVNQHVKEFDTYDDFLKSLDMKVEFKIVSSHNEERPFQLYNKTNQFNLTGMRLQKHEWKQFFLEKDTYCVTGKLQDSFGDHGIVLVALIKIDQETIAIENVVLSCRVFNCGVETSFLDWLTKHFNPVRQIKGVYRKTEKNEPCKNFFPNHQFQSEIQNNGDFVYITNNFNFANHYISF